MEFEVGSVLTGKVTAITKFGAFVALASGKSGLVHISEIANAFVSNISDFIKEGQEVSVKVISIDDAGRINLSIKQAQPQQEAAAAAPRQQRFERAPRTQGQQNSQQNPRFANNSGDKPRQNYERKPSFREDNRQSAAPTEATVQKSADTSFEDKLKRFMQDSDSKISGLYSDKKSRRRGRG